MTTPARTPEIRRDGARWVVSGAGAADGPRQSLSAALGALVGRGALPARAPYLRAAGRPVGRWRWLDVAAEEGPGPGAGPRIDGETIRQLAAWVAASSVAIPIDGGPGSRVHGTAEDSATPASGWVHAAVPVHDGDRWHLYVYAELLPELDAALESGRIAHASVHAQGRVVDGYLRDAQLISVAVTNTPAITTLVPASAVVTMSAQKRGEREANVPTIEEQVAAIEERVAALDARLAEVERRLAEMASSAETASEVADLAVAELARTRALAAIEQRRDAEALIEKAVASGLIAPDQTERERWVRLAERDRAHVERVLARLRPIVPTVPQAREPSVTTRVDDSDVRVKAMRAAGLSERAIVRALEKRGG